MTILVSIYIFAVFDVWLYTYFMRGIFERRFESKWKNGLILFAGIFLMILINSRQNFYVNLFGGLMMFFCIAKALYKGKASSIFFYEMIFYVVVSLMEAIGSYVIITDFGKKIAFTQSYLFLDNPLNVVMAKMMSYLCILLMIGLFRKKTIGEHEYPLKKISFLPIASMILMIGIQQSYEGNHMVMIIGTLLLLFANIFMFYCVEEMVVAQEKNKKYELLNSQNAMKEIYYEKMEEISVEHRKYVHNLKDYLQTIGGLSVQNKTEEIIDLLREMETEIEPASYMTFSFAKNLDLIVMIGNLLDNAIEAASQCEEPREIRMFFSQEQGNFETIQIDNTYNGTAHREGEHFRTTKKDEEKHGFGIKWRKSHKSMVGCFYWNQKITYLLPY